MSLVPPDLSAVFYALADGAPGDGDTTMELPGVEALQERLLQAESQASEASGRAAYAELEVVVGSVVTQAVFLDICARAAVSPEASEEVPGAEQDAGASDEAMRRIARRGEDAEFPEVLAADLAPAPPGPRGRVSSQLRGAIPPQVIRDRMEEEYGGYRATELGSAEEGPEALVRARWSLANYYKQLRCIVAGFEPEVPHRGDAAPGARASRPGDAEGRPRRCDGDRHSREGGVAECLASVPGVGGRELARPTSGEGSATERLRNRGGGSFRAGRGGKSGGLRLRARAAALGTGRR